VIKTSFVSKKKIYTTEAIKLVCDLKTYMEHTCVPITPFEYLHVSLTRISRHVSSLTPCVLYRSADNEYCMTRQYWHMAQVSLQPH